MRMNTEDVTMTDKEKKETSQQNSHYIYPFASTLLIQILPYLEDHYSHVTGSEGRVRGQLSGKNKKVERAIDFNPCFLREAHKNSLFFVFLEDIRPTVCLKSSSR
jgi:hypothetical protein